MRTEIKNSANRKKLKTEKLQNPRIQTQKLQTQKRQIPMGGSRTPQTCSRKQLARTLLLCNKYGQLTAQNDITSSTCSQGHMTLSLMGFCMWFVPRFIFTLLFSVGVCTRISESLPEGSAAGIWKKCSIPPISPPFRLSGKYCFIWL